MYVISTSVRTTPGFHTEGGAKNLRIMKTKRKHSPLRFSLVFGSKLGEDQTEKNNVFTQI